MRNNHVREKLRAGEATLGIQMGLGSPMVAELLAHAGYDWLVIETEHNAVDWGTVQHMLMAMNGTDTIPLVRPPSGDPHDILRVLDAGAMGLFVPMVRTATEAEAIVRATRYPPEGIRGFGPLRASQYTIDYPDYFARANENILVALILETREAIDNLEEIAAVDGVDAFVFGLFDLCIAHGLNPMKMPHPEIDTIIDRSLEISRSTGKPMGIGVSTPQQIDQRLDEGFRFLVYGTDYAMLLATAKSGIDHFHTRNRATGTASS